ncbi:MAG: hypothetical protein M1358_04160 [Chloroflexi bacterium]|nr:hypothetical protein [Chloroflexota bacterium]
MRFPVFLELVGILREISLEAIKEQVRHEPLIVVAGSPLGEAYNVFRLLSGGAPDGGLVRLVRGDFFSGANWDLLQRADLSLCTYGKNRHQRRETATSTPGSYGTRMNAFWWSD